MTGNKSDPLTTTINRLIFIKKHNFQNTHYEATKPKKNRRTHRKLIFVFTPTQEFNIIRLLRKGIDTGGHMYIIQVTNDLVTIKILSILT